MEKQSDENIFETMPVLPLFIKMAVPAVLSQMINILYNLVELPLARLIGHGDIKVYKKQEYKEMLEKAGFTKMKIKAEEKVRCHVVAVKI